MLSNLHSFIKCTPKTENKPNYSIYFGTQITNQPISCFNTNLTREEFVEYLTSFENTVYLQESTFYTEKCYYDRNLSFSFVDNKMISKQIIPIHHDFLDTTWMIVYNKEERLKKNIFHSIQNYHHTKTNEVIKIPFKTIQLFFVHTFQDDKNKDTYSIYVHLYLAKNKKESIEDFLHLTKIFKKSMNQEKDLLTQ